MREILFRGKRIDNGKWAFGLPTTRRPDVQEVDAIDTGDYFDNEFGVLVRQIEKVDPETIGQYTGLEDKNCVGIFEGDILRYIKNNRDIDRVPFKVIWDNEYARWAWQDKTKDSLYPSITTNCEILGNVFDNPELLEEQK